MRTRLCVLMVDDNRAEIAMVRRFLEDLPQWEVEFHQCESGDEALGELIDHDPDLVFMDYYLGYESGIDVIRRLREAGARADFVMLTGQGREETAVEAFREGVIDYLPKARLSADALSHAIAKVVEHRLAEESFERYQAELERRIETRTAELQEINQALRREVGERALAEQRLEKTKGELEESVRVRDKFLSLVAHDLRTPFNSMLGLVDLMLVDGEDPLSAGQRELAGEILDGGRAMVHMIDELLDIGRLHTGKIVPRCEFMDARYVAETALVNQGHFAARKGVELLNEVEAGRRIYADPVLFGEVVSNLISNAVKFSTRGSRVEIFSPDAGGTLAVRDRGIGIPDEDLARLFRMEEKVTTIGTAGERGSGLGLPLASEIMAAHGGALEAESCLGEGSVFYARLPMVRPRVLLVDDEEGIRFAFRGYLEQLAVDVVEASSGAEALERTRESPFHLLLTDLSMPEMGGFELIRTLRAQPSTEALPIIVITADNVGGTRERAFEMGADDFVRKPVEGEELLPRVRHFLSG